jgi:hypothetical protein
VQGPVQSGLQATTGNIIGPSRIINQVKVTVYQYPIPISSSADYIPTRLPMSLVHNCDNYLSVIRSAVPEER